MFTIDAILSLGSLIVPPAFDFIKKKFLKPSSDSPEATMSSLALTKPDLLPAYVEATAKYLEAKVKWFNRDVLGSCSQWVVDMRAAIRPIGVILSFAILGGMLLSKILAPEVDQLQLAGIRYFCEVNVGSWFGSRLTKE